VYSYEYGKVLEQQAKETGVKIKIHLKLDVGMGRIGFILRDDVAFSEALEICRSPYFVTEGIFTHFPMADEGERGIDITQQQFDSFCSSIARFESENIRFSIRHCSNSAAAVKFPQYSLDMVRVGVSLYGISSENVGLKNTLSLKTVVSNVKSLKKGDTVGYGSEYVATKDIAVATLPIGYADGFKRENFPNGTFVCINGKLCSITGRICMDQTMVDVSELENIKTGDEVVVYGNGSPINLAAFSSNNKKIPYETMCEISARVPRVYKEGGEIVFIRDSLV
jgi:alanine racemase